MIIKNRRGIATDKLLIIILVILVVVSVFIFLFKIDINKYLRFLPDFGGGEDDEENIGQSKILQSNESCCCLYKDNKNTKECRIAELELNQYCSNKLDKPVEGNWVNVDDTYCENGK